eukprot:TRINITY_DN23276_c0_g1_i1.p3 TRINITY_DN23276_c0_g1~~TRINITY_DN23276_c0_g1_i1.p3  ORF type:complete len:196 (-),score=51.96 TRINITY_DN23276_c0_g1_i1:1011-1598(-)
MPTKVFSSIAISPSRSVATECSESQSSLNPTTEAYDRSLAEILTREMVQALLEVRKAIFHCRYFAANTEEFIKPHEIKSEIEVSYVQYDPMGVVFQIIPYNFPFWLSMKGCAAHIMGGNSILHRTALSTPGVGRALEKLFRDAGFESVFVSIYSDTAHSEAIISDRRIVGLSFIGSTKAGGILASICSKHTSRSA